MQHLYFFKATPQEYEGTGQQRNLQHDIQKLADFISTQSWYYSSCYIPITAAHFSASFSTQPENSVGIPVHSPSASVHLEQKKLPQGEAMWVLSWAQLMCSSTCDKGQMCKAGLCGTAVRWPPLNFVLVGTKQLQKFCKLTVPPRKTKGKFNLGLSGEVRCSHCFVKGWKEAWAFQGSNLGCCNVRQASAPWIHTRENSCLCWCQGQQHLAQDKAHPLKPFNNIRHGAYHFSLKHKRKPKRKSTVCSISTPIKCALLLSGSFTPGSV